MLGPRLELASGIVVQLEFSLRVHPSCITDFPSKKPTIYLRYGVSCFVLRTVGEFLIFFFNTNWQLFHLHTVQYVCLLERPSSWRTMPDVLCSRVSTLMLQSPLSLFVYVAICCHSVFLCRCFYCFWMRSRRDWGEHTVWFGQRHLCRKCSEKKFSK